MSQRCSDDLTRRLLADDCRGSQAASNARQLKMVMIRPRYLHDAAAS
jgi:hypothetical protein